MKLLEKLKADAGLEKWIWVVLLWSRWQVILNPPLLKGEAVCIAHQGIML